VFFIFVRLSLAFHRPVLRLSLLWMCHSFVRASLCISFRLNAKRATATSIHSVFFSLHPFANVGSAVLKLHPIRFATREKVQRVAIDYTNVFQI
jgi:hypothetical protein